MRRKPENQGVRTMRDHTILAYLGIVLLIVLSAFFSGSEISYASANRLRLRSRAESGKLEDWLAFRIYERYEDALIAILIGNNLVNIAASSAATVIAISLMGDQGTWVATLIMTVLILLFGEIMPKVIASEEAEKFARTASVPLYGYMLLLTPAVWLLQKFLSLFDQIWEKRIPDESAVTEDDLETIIDTVEDEGVIDEDRADLLQSALDFDDVLAYEIITPRVDMIAVDADADADETLEIIMDSKYSRIPVYRDTVDNIIGILHLNLVFREMAEGNPVDVEELMLPPVFVHKTMPLPDVLRIMKAKKSHLVVVTDEYGGTMGILSMEDVLEQLVGDIWDESDIVEDEIVELGPGRYDVDADMRLEDFLAEMDLDDQELEDDNTTVGGWAIEQIGRYPRVGDRFSYRNLTITVKSKKKLRVMRLLVTVNPEQKEEEEEPDLLSL